MQLLRFPENSYKSTNQCLADALEAQLIQIFLDMVIEFEEKSKFIIKQNLKRQFIYRKEKSKLIFQS